MPSGQRRSTNHSFALVSLKNICMIALRLVPLLELQIRIFIEWMRQLSPRVYARDSVTSDAAEVLRSADRRFWAVEQARDRVETRLNGLTGQNSTLVAV